MAQVQLIWSLLRPESSYHGRCRGLILLSILRHHLTLIALVANYLNFITHIAALSYFNGPWRGFILILWPLSWHYLTLMAPIVALSYFNGPWRDIILISWPISWHFRSPHVIRVILMIFEIFTCRLYCLHTIQVVLMTFEISHVICFLLTSLKICSWHSRCPHNIQWVIINFFYIL